MSLVADRITIRSIKIDDLEAVLPYINALSAERTFIRFQGEQISVEDERAYLENAVAEVAAQRKVNLLAWLDGQLVGISDVTLGDKTERHIGRLGLTVAKEYRGQGIGKRLLTEAIKQASALPGIEIIELHVFAENTLAQQLYTKFGFREFGRLPNGVYLDQRRDDLIYMHLPLK